MATKLNKIRLSTLQLRISISSFLSFLYDYALNFLVRLESCHSSSSVSTISKPISSAQAAANQFPRTMHANTFIWRRDLHETISNELNKMRKQNQSKVYLVEDDWLFSYRKLSSFLSLSDLTWWLQLKSQIYVGINTNFLVVDARIRPFLIPKNLLVA